jgi:arginine:ornithine antiporter / lysine permease
MNMALIISVLGGFLSWVLIAAEVPYFAGKHDGLFPKVFTLENKVNFPVGALLLTATITQLYLIFAHFYDAGYMSTISLAAVMVLPPYLFSAFYALLLAIQGKTYIGEPKRNRFRDLLISFLAFAYAVWLLYAAGWLLLMSSILYFIGSLLFTLNKIWRRTKIFNKYELIVFLMIGTLSVISIVSLITGRVTL